MIRGNLKIQYLLEIIVVIICVFLSVPLWNQFNGDEMKKVADYYDSYYYISYNVEPVEDHDKVILSNDSYTKEDYKLVLKVKDKENIKLDNIKVNVNDDIYNLTDLDYVKDKGYYNVILDNSSLVADTLIYDVKLLCDEEIEYDFLVTEKI